MDKKKFRRDTLKQKAAGIGANAAVYFLLICIGFVFLYPLLYMVVTSLMCTEDLVNPTITWVPTRLDLSNFEMVWSVLDYPTSLGISVSFSVVCAVLQTVSCALMGYALARFNVPCKMLWMAMLIVIFSTPCALAYSAIPRAISVA